MEPELDWQAALGRVTVYGSPWAVEEIAELQDELVYPAYYLAVGGPDAPHAALIEAELDGMAHQQVILSDGRRGFVREEDLSLLVADRLCLSHGA